MASFNGVPVPAEGKPITFSGGRFLVPDTPIIPYIEGDGTGRDIWKAARRVFDAATAQAFGGKRRIVWYEVFAGEKAFRQFSEWLPEGTDRKSTRLNSSHGYISYAVFCLKKKKKKQAKT